MQEPEKTNLTYEDIIALEDQNRYELIDGEIHLLASPLTPHAAINDNLFAVLHNFFAGRYCRAHHAPIDVFIDNQPGDPPSQIHTVFQPDIFVICDRNQRGKRGYFGPPALVIEILSRSTAGMDRIVKYNKYQNAGVQEYWIVDPDKKLVHLYALQDGKYCPMETYLESEQLQSVLFPDLTIDLQEIFQDW